MPDPLKAAILSPMLWIVLSALALLLGTHYLIYRSAVFAFDVTRLRVKVVLLIGSMALATSVPLATLLQRLHPDAVTRGVHALSWFWLGLALHLAMFLALAWAIHGISRLLGGPVALRGAIPIAALLAVSASLYGLWNAYHPIVRSFELEIRDLPESWEGRTVVQLSDVHLGSVHGSGFLKRVVEMVNALEPEAIFITGDLFNGSCSGYHRFKEGLDALRAPRGVYFVTGNHEGYAGLTVPLAFLKQTKIRVLDDECVQVDGLQIVGISFPWFSRRRAAVNPFDPDGCYRPDRPSILLYHTPTDIQESFGDREIQQIRSYFAPETRFSFAARAGVDLQLSGHTHRGQMFPFGILTKLLWNGFDRGLHRIGGLTLYVSSGAGTWGPPVRTSGRSEVVAITLTRSRIPLLSGSRGAASE